MICPYCNKDKLDTCERPDRYAQEVHNEKDATHIACDDCDQQCADDI
jgi:transcription elongation factor Elf1